MSRTETASNPLVENSSSAAHRIASRMFGLRGAVSSLSRGRIISACTDVQITRSRQQIFERSIEGSARRSSPSDFEKIPGSRQFADEHLPLGKSNLNRRPKPLARD